MYRIILLFALLTLGSEVFSQEQDTLRSDSTKIKLGDSEIIFVGFDGAKCNDSLSEKERKKQDWTGISGHLGINGYLTTDNSLKMREGEELMEVDYGRSRSFAVMHTSYPWDVVSDRIYLTAGLGFLWNNYSFKNPVTINNEGENTAFVADSADMYDKYKLRVAYLQVPLMMGVRFSKSEKPVDLQLGVVAGLKLGSVVKFKYDDSGVKFKGKVKDDFDLNPFRFELAARLRFDDFGLFVNYSLTKLFDDSNLAELAPFSCGIVIGEF